MNSRSEVLERFEIGSRLLVSVRPCWRALSRTEVRHQIVDPSQCPSLHPPLGRCRGVHGGISHSLTLFIRGARCEKSSRALLAQGLPRAVLAALAFRAIAAHAALATALLAGAAPHDVLDDDDDEADQLLTVPEAARRRVGPPAYVVALSKLVDEAPGRR